MNQEKHAPSEQVEYLGRWVDRKYFRAFVYNEKEKKLASNYDEFTNLLASGLWFDSQEAVSKYLSNKNIDSLKPINNVETLREKTKNVLKRTNSGL